MKNENLTIEDIIAFIFSIFENEAENFINLKSHELGLLDNFLYKKEYKYFSFFMLLYTIASVSKDIKNTEYTGTKIRDMYIKKYENEPLEIMFNRVHEYLIIIAEEEDNITKKYEKVASKFTENVNGGIDTYVKVLMYFMAFMKYNSNIIRDVLIIISNTNDETNTEKFTIINEKNKKLCSKCKKDVIPTFHGLCPDCDTNLDMIIIK